MQKHIGIPSENITDSYRPTLAGLLWDAWKNTSQVNSKMATMKCTSLVHATLVHVSLVHVIRERGRDYWNACVRACVPCRARACACM